MTRNNCFVCTGDIQSGISAIDNSSSEENSILLCQILELRDLGNETEQSRGRMSFCAVCLNKLLNIRDMLEELERLEKKVLDEKYSIELQLKDKEKSQGQNSTDHLRDQIVTELRAASIETMLHKIRKKRLGQRRNPKGSWQIRIMKSVTIPDISCETIQPISHDPVQTGNFVFSSQESESQLLHRNSLLSNPQSSFMGNDQLENQAEDRTNEEPLTAGITETIWTSGNEECDIKYEIGIDSDMAIDPLQPELDHSDFPHQNDQISTKSEVDDVADVNKFLDAQLTTTNEDPPSNMNFICGTCGAGFVSYNQLKIHDRTHMKGANGRKTLKNIRRQEVKSRDNTTKLKAPSMRPKKCEECGKVLSCNDTWSNHVMSIHRGQYKFKCTLCNYGCQLQSDLRKHIMEHSMNRGYFNCSKCNRGFKSEQARTVHMVKSKCSAFTPVVVQQ